MAFHGCWLSIVVYSAARVLFLLSHGSEDAAFGRAGFPLRLLLQHGLALEGVMTAEKIKQMLLSSFS